MNAIAIIPARYASTRLPGKPLLNRTGKTLIEHVYERVRAASRIRLVVIATDDPRIAAAAMSFGAQVRMTRSDHPSGTDRVAEAAASLDADLVLNVQGDEPEISPEDLDRLVEAMAGEPADVPMGTLACPSTDPARYLSPDTVKVTVDRHGRALYFSRAPIPWDRDRRGIPEAGFLKHVGVYAYRPEFLQLFPGLDPTPLERIERLEQLRAIEHGYAIRVVRAEVDPTGVDTPEDYERFVARTTTGGTA